MKHIQVLLAVVAVGLVGCRAQEGGKVSTPGLPPQAIGDVVVVEVNSTNNSIAALANDIDQSGTGLTITAVAVDQTLPPMPGAVATTNGTTVTFTPPATFVGVVTLQYSIMDGTGATSSGAIAVSVLPVAPPPVALPDTATVLQNSGATDVDVLANDIDLAAGGLTVTGVTVTASVPTGVHAVAVVGNQVRFTPAPAFIGAVVVGYTIEDINGATADGVLTVVVTPVAVPVGPVPVPDAEVVAQDSGATSIDVLANDVDPVGGGLTVTNVTVTASVPVNTHAVAVVGNEVQFTPAAGFVGSVIVTYTATDTDGNSADGVLTIVVSPLALEPGPVPVPDATTVAQDAGATLIDVLANDVDPAGGGLTVTNVTVTTSVPTGTHAVAIVGNEVEFTPAAGFFGSVVVTYVATDANGNSADGVLAIIVMPAGLAMGPVPVPDAATVMQDSGATLVDVLANDIDPVGGGLTVTNVAVTASVPTATHAVAIAGNEAQFTPAAGFAGSVVVTYTATDADGNSADGVLTIVVSPLALPIGPVPVPDAAVVAQDSSITAIDVLANDIDPAGGGLTLGNVVVVSSLPTDTHTVAINANQVEFTPAAAFAGSVVITYTATDVDGNSADGVLVITVSPLALAIGPVPLPDAAVVMQDSGATLVDVLANDVDPVGGGLTVTNVTTTASVPTGTHTVVIAGNQVEFTPDPGFAGSVVVTYTTTDADGNSADGALNIVVSPLNPPVGLVAIPDTAVVAQDSVNNDIDVLANDVDFAGGGLTVTNVSVFSSLPTGTHAAVIVGNQVRFTPDAAFAGVVVLQYTATDVNGATSNGLVNVTVTPAALTLGPVAVPDIDTASSSGGPQSFDVLANDVDPAGGGLTLTLASIDLEVPAGSGSVAIVGNQIEYTPSAAYIGAVLIGYTATDTNGNTTSGQLSLTVMP